MSLKNLLSRFFILFLFLSLLSCTETESISKEYFVTEVVDGDTITIQGGARVRLLGINAPEKGEKGYSEAKVFLKEKILNKKVILESDGPDLDRYDRLLRHIWFEEQLVSESLAKEGLVKAKYYAKSQRYSELIALAESEAMSKKIGLWK